MAQRDMAAGPLTPFAFGWGGFELGVYRPCDGTYSLFPYDSLPPIPEVDGTLSWLDPLHEVVDRQMQVHRNDPAERGVMGAIAAQAERLGLTLPPSFTRLMGSPELQDRIPSCTACYFELSTRIMPCPGSAAGYIVRFLNDQQDVLTWYLYLTHTAEHCVLVSPIRLDDEGEPGQSEEDRRKIIENFWVCAPSFDEFIYRFWLENVVWFKLNGDDDTPLTAAERRYLAHYHSASSER